MIALSSKDIELRLNRPIESFPSTNLQSVTGWEYGCLSQKTDRIVLSMEPGFPRTLIYLITIIMKMKKWSSQWTQFMLILTLGAGQLWVHMFPWKKWVLIIYEINHIWTAEMKWRWTNVSGFIAQLVEHRTGNREVTGSNPVQGLNFFQASLRNCINCVHCDDHFFIFISFPQFIYDLFHISLIIIIIRLFI